MSLLRVECEACGRSYEYDGAPVDACPECGSADVAKAKALNGTKTGTYRYIAALGTTAKVSDRVPGIRGANATRKVPAGAKCVNKGGACGC